MFGSELHGVIGAVFSASVPCLRRAAPGSDRGLDYCRAARGPPAESPACRCPEPGPSPMRPCFHPEHLGRHTASLSGGEQTAGHDRVGLGDPAIEVITKLLAQRLRRAADDLGDVVLTDSDPSQMAHPFAYRFIDGKRFSRHWRSPIDLGPGCRRARRTIAPKLDEWRRVR